MDRVEWRTDRHALPRIIKRPVVIASGYVTLGGKRMWAFISSDGKRTIGSDDLKHAFGTYDNLIAAEMRRKPASSAKRRGK